MDHNDELSRLGLVKILVYNVRILKRRIQVRAQTTYFIRMEWS